MWLPLSVGHARYMLFHLAQLGAMDTITISDDAKQLAEATYAPSQAKPSQAMPSHADRNPPVQPRSLWLAWVAAVT